MKFSLSWLRQHLDTDADAAAIAETLTAIGLEVEGVENPAEALAPFRVAKVLTAEKHPQADKLQVLTVDAGDGAVQVVCGAPNARAGMLGVFGPPGAYVPGSDLTLKVAAIRGVESRGMMCSVRELQIGEEHDGIIELAGDAPVGAAFADFAGLNDPVFDVNVTPNRQDCMGVRGIARDLAAAGVGTLKPLGIPQIEGSFKSPIDIRIEDQGGCPAFFGRAIRGIRNGPSPEWLQRRLKSAGQRPISAVVDLTNYVMLDLGRPAHAYDIAKLDGALIARAARDGEKVLALNEKEYVLDPSMTVIADERQVHDIGGIMGGERFGRYRGHHRRDAGDRLLHTGPDRADRPEACADQRRPHPLRARRRSGLPRRWARHPHRPDPRHLRRRSIERDPRRHSADRGPHRPLRRRARIRARRRRSARRSPAHDPRIAGVRVRRRDERSCPDLAS